MLIIDRQLCKNPLKCVLNVHDNPKWQAKANMNLIPKLKFDGKNEFSDTKSCRNHVSN